MREWAIVEGVEEEVTLESEVGEEMIVIWDVLPTIKKEILLPILKTKTIFRTFIRNAPEIQSMLNLIKTFEKTERKTRGGRNDWQSQTKQNRAISWGSHLIDPYSPIICLFILVIPTELLIQLLRRLILSKNDRYL
jgi:hypothetical protein